MSLFKFSSSEPADAAPKLEENKTATPEHCFHAFDALYCALTHREHVKPDFPDES